MSNIQKHTKEFVLTKDKFIISGDGAPAYSINDGDFVIDKHHAYSVLKVKIEGDCIALYREGGNLYSKYTKSGDRSSPYSDWNWFSNTYVVVPVKSFSMEEVDKALAVGFSEEKPEQNTDSCFSLVSKKQSDMVVIRDKQFNLIKKQEAFQALIKFRKNELQSATNRLQEQLENMNTVLWQMALYSSVADNIVQIQEGLSCDAPVSIRQKILFMDEEITHNNVENAEFDFYDIKKFDEWLTQEHEKFNKKNYEIMLPEEKGVVVFKVRRSDKDYQDKWANAINNQYNRSYYVFLRNGTNLYRIFTENYFGYNLLPTEEDFGEMGKEGREGDKAILSARQNMLVIQGIIDNTTLFNGPNFAIAGMVNLLDEKTYDNKVVPVFDNENIIAPLKTYRDYQKEVNKEIKIGSRIVFFGGVRVGAGASTSYWERKDGVNLDIGVYTVVGYGESGCSSFTCWDSEEFHGYYKVMGEDCGIMSRDSGRKKARYIYYDECFNYDLLDLETLEGFMYDRISRENTENLPHKVKLLKRLRLSEKKYEDSLVKNLSLRFNEEAVYEAISWWKLKNKWKRGIMSDDSKALRMIIKRLEKNGA